MSMLVGVRRALLGFGPGTTYYVDATGGNDANRGSSEDVPWQTIAKVNASTFQPGDQILFKRGETWTGTKLLPSSSGEPERYITFGAYGTGNKPVFDGNDTVDCIGLNGKSYIKLENLYAFQGLNFGIEASGPANNCLIQDCDASDCGNDNVNILGANVHDILVIGLTSWDAYQRVAGPRISCLEIADGAYNITIRDSEMYGSEQAGITIHSHPATGFPYNITITNCSAHDNDLFGITLSQDNAILSVADANIVCSNCTFNDNAGGVGTGGGIWITKTGDPYPTGILFDQCIAISASDRPCYVAGKGTFTRCVFYATYATQLDASSGATFYNCTFYRGAGGASFETINNPDGVVLRNCIIATEANAIIYIRAGATNVDIDYTLYWSTAFNPLTTTIFGWLGNWYTWANWLVNSGQDANSPTPANPLFTNPAGNDFTLQVGSPAIDAGVNVGLPYCETAPDCGAYEYCP